MTKQWYEIWFNDGNRYLANGEDELRLTANIFNFDADEVIAKKECSLIDDEGDQVGGVQLLEKERG